MVDPTDIFAGTGGVGAGITLAKKTADAVQYIFGGYAGEAREALRRLGEHQLRNVGRVIEKTDQKTNHSINPQGSVSMRTGFRILQEAVHADDEMIVEYLAGILASTRMAEKRRADVGTSYVSLISSLAAEYIRLHYVLYRAMQVAAHGRTMNLYDANTVNAFFNVFVPSQVFVDTDLLPPDHDLTSDLDELNNGLMWLVREELIDLVSAGDLEHYQTGIQYVMPQNVLSTLTSGGCIVRPTPLGVALFTWAFGKGDNVDEYLAAPLQDFAISELLVSETAIIFSR